MSTLTVFNWQGEAVGQVDVPESLKAGHSADQALVQTIVTLRANARQGTACTKNKGEVAGSGKKPWRQKGTGRARAGYRRSPLWVGGGVVFGPKPRSYAKRLPRGVAALALRRALSDKVAEGTLKVVESFSLGRPKTKELVAALARLQIQEGALLVTAEPDRALMLAARNVPNVHVARAADVTALEIVHYPVLVVTRESLAVLQRRAGNSEEKGS